MGATMTKSELFKRAHKMVRATFDKFGKADYRATFGACLRAILSGFLGEVSFPKPARSSLEIGAAISSYFNKRRRNLNAQRKAKQE